MLADIKYGVIELTPNDIFRFKRKLYKKMAKQLKIDKANGDVQQASKWSLYKEGTERHKLFKPGSSNEQIIDDMNHLRELMELRNFRLVGETTESGRYDHFSHMEARVDVFKFLDEPSEVNVNALTRRFVAKCIYKEKWDKWRNINCEVMALFKDGTISWDDVVNRHLSSCSI